MGKLLKGSEEKGPEGPVGSESVPTSCILQQRSAGVIMHITSLPNPQDGVKTALGQLNQWAWRFVDWMASAGLRIWQVLPLNQPHGGLSPYSALSAFAMNPAFLPADWQVQFDALDESKFAKFLAKPPQWLEDYALFMVLREHFDNQAWNQWPEDFKRRKASVLAKFAKQQQDAMLFLKKQQFMLHELWHQLKDYANSKQVYIFGDMPIFVALDSADVWANPEQFKLDENLEPTVVAGVPPDYFSETGQRWGNPHYDWQAMQSDQFAWWHQRINHSLELLDVLRIDHFRGLEASWEIDASEETAINGVWKKTPGAELLQSLQDENPNLPIVAEDLGVITDEVVALKNQFGLPGMAVLQFGFDGQKGNPHALENQIENSVAYSGTHDNDTTIGWFDELEAGSKQWISSLLQPQQAFLGSAGLPEKMPWPLLSAGMRCQANWFIAPMQDWLMLDGTQRMNTPGTTEGNWLWQSKPDDFNKNLADQISQLSNITKRL